jgi:hypothetical protein
VRSVAPERPEREMEVQVVRSFESSGNVMDSAGFVEHLEGLVVEDSPWGFVDAEVSFGILVGKLSLGIMEV